jgi:hypothetical protein
MNEPNDSRSRADMVPSAAKVTGSSTAKLTAAILAALVALALLSYFIMPL